MDRSNHYEAAFEAYLRRLGVGFVAVDETHRSLLGDADVKSLDFVIVDSARLVVDVKGRRFPGGTPHKPRRIWQNWSTADDVDGLDRWAAHFGSEFRGVLAFVYHLVPPFGVSPGTRDALAFRDQLYLVRGIDAVEYRERMVSRSRRWGTVGLSTADFRELVRPFSDFLDPKLPKPERMGAGQVVG